MSLIDRITGGTQTCPVCGEEAVQVAEVIELTSTSPDEMLVHTDDVGVYVHELQ